MFNPLNRARSPQYNGYPNQTNPNPQFGGNSYPFMGQQSPVNQPLTQRSFPQQQYPQNTPPKGYPLYSSCILNCVISEIGIKQIKRILDCNINTQQQLSFRYIQLQVLQQSQRSNPPFAQQQQYPPNQPSVQSIQPPPQSQPPQQAPQQNYVQPPQRSQQPMPPQSIEQQKLPSPQINLQAQPQQYAPSQSSALGLSGLRQTYTPPTFVPLQPVMTTVIQRPIEFVDLEKFEELWDKRMKELEDRIRQSQPQVVELRSSNDEDKDALIKQLQDELYKVRCDNEEKDNKISDLKIELQTNIDLVEYLRQQLVNSNNSDEVEKLQNEIQRLRKQVQTLDSQVSQLNHNNADLKQELEALRQQKQFFKSQCDDKDEHIQNLEREIEELRQQVETLTEEVTTSQSVKTYEEEAKIWRTKFKELNDTYHACQEKLILTEAELDLLKRPQSQQKIVTTSTTVVKNNVQTSGTKSDSDYLSSSLTQQDVERIQNLSKNIPQI